MASIEKGAKIAQLVLVPVVHFRVRECECECKS